MSVTEFDGDAAEDDGLCEFPAFDLRVLVDDVDEPERVTLYPAAAEEADLATTWISADVEAAVPLSAAR